MGHIAFLSLSIAVIVILAFGTICFGIGNVVYTNVLTPKVYKMMKKAAAAAAYQEQFKQNEFDYEGVQWFKKMAPNEAVVTSKRNEKLHGYIIPAPEKSEKWAICVHGYTGTPDTMGPYGREFYNMGFNTLYPCLGGHEHSEHHSISMGWHDRLDLVDWCEYITSQSPGSSILLFGVSMGAAAVMMASGEKLPCQVKCIIEDCGFSSVWDLFSYQLKKLYRLPDFPLIYSANAVARIRDHFDFKRASCVAQVKKSMMPTLFIHGGNDQLIPAKMMEELYDAAICEKEKLLIENAKHTGSAVAAPNLYWPAVKSFISKHMA